jgi:hypothetical protein
VAPFLRRLALFLLILALLSFGLSEVYGGWVMRKSLLARTERQFREYEGPLRYLFLGDSHIQCAVDPAELPPSFNFSSSAESYDMTEQKLRSILADGDLRDRIGTVVLPLGLHSFSSFRGTRIRSLFYWKRYLDFPALGRRKGDLPGYLVKQTRAHLFSYWQRGDDFVTAVELALTGGEGRHELHLGQRRNPGELSRSRDITAAADERAATHFRRAEWCDPTFVLSFRLCLDHCRREGKPVVLLGCPVTREYRDAVLDYRPPGLPLEVAEEIAMREGEVFLLDDTRLLFGENGLFADPDHLNARGARVFSRRLAAQLEALLGD